ncbi:MAG: tRNA (N(6)-L-threonylcarbamoyladenosine(37)-C(2))-methylthiotransferase MtaB [bacterium]
MKKIYFKTFGCKVNQYETELIRMQLHEAGLISVEMIADADWCVINTCTVTNESDSKCRHMTKKVLRDNPKCRVIVTGCFVEHSSEELKKLSPRIETFTQDKKNDIPSFIIGSEVLFKHQIGQFHNHTRAFVKIQDGCDAFCSYCIVPHVRSKVSSREKQPILQEIASLIKHGHKEIVLTGIRLGKFSNGSYTLSDLVEEIAAIEGSFRVRLSSLEIKEIDDKLLDLMSKNNKLCKHLHIPLQSGDDEILHRMNRPYTAEEFLKKIKHIKEIVPDAALTTDVIVGYPGETEIQFENTFNMINFVEFSRLHVFRFSPRSGTPAAGEVQNISSNEIFMRMSIMKVINAILRKRFAEKFLGKVCRVLPEIKKHNKIHGFTDQYIKVVLPCSVDETAFVSGPLTYCEEKGYSLEINV